MSYRYEDAQPGLDGIRAVPGWIGRKLGKGIWQLVPDPTRSMTMTGSPVTLDAVIPIPHRLVRVEWKHTDVNSADDTDACAAIFERVGQSGLITVMYSEAATTSSSTIIPFGEGYEYNLCTYRWSFNTTSTNLVYPEFWIQELRERRPRQ